MALNLTRQFLLASAAAASAATASAQSFHHAPPTAPGAGDTLVEQLLPIIQPGASGARIRSPFDGWSAERRNPTQQASTEPPAPPQPTIARTEPSGPRPVWVPPHLSRNQWAKSPEKTVASNVPTPRIAGSERLPTIKPKPSPIPPTPPVPATTVANGPDRARGLAAEAIARGDGAKAEQILAQAAEKFPSDARLVAALARARESQKDWVGAIIAYDVLERLEPSEPRWRARRAECRYQAGQFDRASQDFQLAASSSTLSFDEYARFADAALRSGEAAVAEEALGALSKAGHGPTQQTELLRGLAALKQGKADQARGILLQAGARWPNDRALTEALRLAAAVHYGDRPAPSLVSTIPSSEGSADAIVTTAAVSEPAEVQQAGVPPAPAELPKQNSEVPPAPAPMLKPSAKAPPAPAEPTKAAPAELPGQFSSPEEEPRPIIRPAAGTASARTAAAPEPLVCRWRKSRPLQDSAEAPSTVTPAAMEFASDDLDEDPTSEGWHAAEPQLLGDLGDGRPLESASRPAPVEAAR